MKKIFIGSLLFFIVFSSLSAIEIIHKEKKIEFSYEELKKEDQIKVTTTRGKKGETIMENWQGISLKKLFEKLEINNFGEIKFISSDNYLIRLSKEQFYDNKLFLAFRQNDKDLSNSKIRLVIPKMRDMFWIQGIETIVTSEKKEFELPSIIYFAENVLVVKKVIIDPVPFKKCHGFWFDDLINDYFPKKSDEFLLIGKDSVTHILDYEKYLSNAVLENSETGFILKSPDMPAGMWIKDIAYVQQDERAIVFKKHFSNWQEIQKITGWDKIPTEMQITYQNGKQKTVKTNFGELENWDKIRRIDW